MSLIDKITLEDLEGDQRDLAELIGLEPYKSLVQTYGGCNIYVQKIDRLIRDTRDNDIRKKFNGFNFQDLAIEYNLSERMIREITSDELKELKAKPIDGQISCL
jgi:Mor family transcriptional regulator